MLYALGVVAFAFVIVFSICLHEFGHMLTAKAFGMSVSRYFIGFGRTIFSFRRGETEYGLKAIPAGGFVTIVGMNPADVEDGGVAASQGRAFYQYATWKRSIVLAAGSITHVLLAMLLLYLALVAFGLPRAKPSNEISATIGTVYPCVVPGYDVDSAGSLRACRQDDPRSPAQQAGLQAGDRITRLGDRTVDTYADLQSALQAAPVDRPLDLTYVRDGSSVSTTITLVPTQRPAPGVTDPNAPTHPTPTIGIGSRRVVETIRKGPIEGLVDTGDYTWQMITGSVSALGALPSRVPALVDSLTGAQRSPEDPVSVVGASRLGGELAQNEGASGIGLFFAMLSSLNIFLALFNLLPLPPLDGGHLVIGWFERVRSFFAARTGRPEPGMVDRNRLVPLTLAVIMVFGAFTLLTVSADIVNPIRLG
jgi:membrane-associated protease RseP (regulator of RpoE activity)